MLVAEALEDVFTTPVLEAYGMTEAAHQMACNPLPPACRKPGSVGLPAGVEIAIADASGARLPAWPTGGTLCIPLGAEFQAVTSALNSLGAQFDSRGDVIRLSFHACNAEDDALRIARAWQGGH